MAVIIGEKGLTIEDVVKVSHLGDKVVLHPFAIERIKKCRSFIDEKIKKHEVIYGVTTGIGALSKVLLTREEAEDLQKYIIYSHSAGIGNPLSENIVRSAILSKINVLSQGLSAPRLEVVLTLVEMLNKEVTPVVCSHGSVGASGDLAPMAQVALVLIGKGEAFYQGKRLPAAVAMQRAKIPTITFQHRDGLAIINGANVICGMGCLLISEAERFIKTQDIATAMTLEALNGNMNAYDERIHRVRGYSGAIDCAENIRRITDGSKILERPGKNVQDAYSLRSTSQVVGSARDTLNFARQTFLTELNGVGDNPLFFYEENDILNGANFQGTPLSFALEFLGIALTTVCVLSERRLNRLMNPHLSMGLPAFLAPSPVSSSRGKSGGRGTKAGMFSGLMLSQYTAGALVCENRCLCTPASIGSIPASADQEDFVSMGMTSALKTRQIMDNTYGILGIELIAAAQALDLLKPLTSSPATQKAREVIRKYIPYLSEDRPLYNDHNTIARIVREGEILRAVEKIVGKLK
ncbi:MAG: aromatic amino acid ammonia-lyase [Planctomycetota bacterium]|nr:aromatic amino acid ammonia-lyase [Planctomycetota bacterium]MDI6787178.1 aromatic amino acid ammonia-lyase [Planctomycetota bacterium]